MQNDPLIPVGDLIRLHRVERLGKGLREMAKLLDIAPAHLTDIEKGRRSPSEDLLLRIARQYGVDESVLRAGWGKAEADVGLIAARNPVNAAKIPELLRTAKDLDAAQWDALIAQAKSMAAKVGKKSKPK